MCCRQKSRYRYSPRRRKCLNEIHPAEISKEKKIFWVRLQPVFETRKMVPSWDLWLTETRLEKKNCECILFAFQRLHNKRHANYRCDVIYAVKSHKTQFILVVRFRSFVAHRSSSSNEWRWRRRRTKKSDSINRNYWIFTFIVYDFGICVCIVRSHTFFSNDSSRSRYWMWRNL